MKSNFKLIAVLVLLIITPISKILACTNIILTKGATTDGSTLVTYAADSNALYGVLYFSPAAIYNDSAVRAVYEWDTGKYLGDIPQAKQTYQRVGNMNEYQLIITETTFGGRNELRDPKGVIDYGSLIYITLERAKTAREAISVIGDLVEKYGYYSSGESFSIADTKEAWIMEIIGKGEKEKGAVWVAVKIPDGYISAHANHSRISTFNQKDPENCIYSDDVISFARSQGYFDGKDKDFSFTDAYAPADFLSYRACEARVWSIYNQAGCDVDEYLDYAMGYDPKNRIPLYMKAPEKISPKQAADFMRDHYDGTVMDKHTDIGAGGEGSPYRWGPLTFKYEGKTYFQERAIATQQTGWWIMAQARDYLPREVGALLWFGVDDAATSCLTPIYVATKQVPNCFKEGNGSLKEYSDTSAFWIFNRVAQFAYLRYNTIYPDIKKVIDAHENGALSRSNAIDKVAVELLKESKDKAVDFMTQYSLQTAQTMFDNWTNLDRYLMVKYIDGGVKKEDENGFMSNGNELFVPASPTMPGYSEKWKEAVVKDTGDKKLMK